MDSQRIYALTTRLFEYVKSPSLKHLRDPHSIQKLAHDLLTAVDRASSIWTKWDGPREQIAKSAAHCWIPVEDLQAYLNHLPGPRLTKTDVVQRLRAVHEEPYGHYPNDDVKASCLELYEAEKAQGTEMPAIIGALQEHIELEEDRLSREREEARLRYQAEERLRAQQRFMAVADCGWTKLDGLDGAFAAGTGGHLKPCRTRTNAGRRFGSPDLKTRARSLARTRDAGTRTRHLRRSPYGPEPQW